VGALRRKNLARALRILQPFAQHHQPHLILSNESLYATSADVLTEFCAGVRALGFQIKCLVFFRPQADLIVSSYLQGIKENRGTQGELTEYAADLKDNPRLNWLACAEKLETAFGAGNVTVYWFPAVRDRVVEQGFRWLGLSPLNEEIPLINPTPGRESMSILQLVNKHGFGGRAFADEFLIKAERQGLLGSKVGLDPRLAAQIWEATLASNQELLRRYCSGIELKEFVSASDAAETRPNPDILRRLAALASELLLRRGVDPSTVSTMLEPAAVQNV
jgi:hypothetical protein